MSKKIFRSIWILTIGILIAVFAMVMTALYSHFSDEQLEELRNETELVTQGVSLNGEAYFTGLDVVDFRITWITADGEIIYDNEADTAIMENHLEREEIRSAIETGYGESRRYSATLSEMQLYRAQRMSDGSIIRLSITQATIWSLFLRFSLPLFIIIVAALVLSLFIASHLSRRIVEPLNALDLDHPKAATEDIYDELKPLLRRLEDQHIQIERDKEELEKTSLIRQEFTANASHELKTPLHAISGYAELIETGMVKSEDVPTFAGMIRSESQRMTKLVEDIIDLSYLDGGAAGVEREECDLYRIAQNALEALETEAHDAGVKITLRGESAVMQGIPTVLYSVAYNLCTNAIKYSDSGKEVTVDVINRPGQAVLSVKDQGIGIPKKDLNRIFERFYRVDKSRSKKVGGTGLGLSIVKHAALIHGANIDVISEPGKGSVFTVTFPK